MPDAAFDYAADPRGDAELRAELAAYLVRVRGLAVTDVVLTNGYTQGLWLTCRALAARGAKRVAVEDPSLDDAWATIRSAGLEVVGLPVDEHGVVLDALDADALLVTPAHQFPTGAVLAPERRRALLAWGGIVIEDDYDSEYRYDRAPVGTLQRLAPDRVVYLGTASKTLAPALRLGWLVAPPELADEIARERWSVDSGGDAVTARAYARLLASGEVDRHLRRTRREYRERRDRLVAALGRHGFDVGGVAAGLHLLLRLPPGTDEAAVVERLAGQRIRVRGLAELRPVAASARARARLRAAAAGGDRGGRRSVGERRVAADLLGDHLDVVDGVHLAADAAVVLALQVQLVGLARRDVGEPHQAERRALVVVVVDLGVRRVLHGLGAGGRLLQQAAGHHRPPVGAEDSCW